MAVYDGLTRNQWPGTWSPSSNHPIVLDTEIRGALRFASGGAGDTLTDITGQRLQEGMLVYLKTGYGSFTSNTYYKYSLLVGESRNAATGAMPNAVGNWSVVTFAGASELSALSDVSTTAPSTGQVLKWDGTEWAPAADSTSGGGAGIALTDISVTQDSASGNGTLSYNNVTGVITYTPPVLFDGAYASLTGAPTIPTDITDLSITDGTSGQVLTTDGSGNFSFTTASGGASALGGLTDVASTTPSAGQVLKWSGTQWEPASDSTGAGGSGIDLTDISVTIAGAAGGGSLTYNNSTGVFLFTPADVSGFSTFSGAYADLSGKPTLFSGDYSDLTNIPASSDNMELSITGGTNLNLVNGTDNSIIDTVDLAAITSSLDYTQLDNLPTLFSGDYDDLTNTPSIPSLTGYATESFVQTYVLSTITTDNLLEGGTNLFFNDERVDDRVAALISAGTGLSTTYNDAGNLLTISSTSASLNVAADGATTDVIDLANNETLTVSGGTGITTAVATNEITVNLDDTAVTPGSYGSASLVPVITVDQQGRLTSASTVSVAGVTDFDYDTATGILDIDTADGGNFTATVTLAPFTTTDLTEGTNLYYTQARFDSAFTATDTDALSEGTTNLYYTAARDTAQFDTDLATKSTTDLTEGTNLYYTDTRAQTAITGGTAITNTAGTLDLDDTAVTPGSYGSGTEIPVITVDQQGRITGSTVATVSSDLPIAGDTGTDTVSLLTDTLTFTGGVGVTTTVATDAVTIDIGQSVGTTDDVTFNDVTVSGDLEVLGTLTSLNTTNTEITDNTIILNQGETGAGVTAGSSGIEVARGTESNVSFIFEESGDNWSTGDIRLVTGDLHAGEEIKSTITTSGGIVVNDRNIVLAGQTTDATPTEIYLNDGTGKIEIASGATAKFKATIVCTDTTDTAAFNITGLIQNVAGTTSLIGTNIIETIAEDSGSNWLTAITADDSADYLKIVVTGEASKTIDWTVFLDISEVKR